MKNNLFFKVCYIILLMSITAHTICAQTPWGTNLLVNPSCDSSNTDGWVTPATGGTSFGCNGTTYWQSSYQLGYMRQTIDLVSAGFTTDQLDAGATLLLEALYSLPKDGTRVGEAGVTIYAIDNLNDTLETYTLLDRTYSSYDILPWIVLTQKATLPIGTRYIIYELKGKSAIN